MRAQTQFYTAMGLFAAAFIAATSSGFLFWKAKPAIAEVFKDSQIESPINSQRCADVARSLSFEVNETEGVIVAGLKSMKDPELDFGRASSLVASCRGYELAHFCAGPGCAVNNGKELQLRLLSKSDG